MISFKIPQKIPMNLGYYYSPDSPEVVTTSDKLSSNLYIGISLGGAKAHDLSNHRYIYFLQSEAATPQLVDEYMVPQTGHIYLLSSTASTVGGRNTWFKEEYTVPAGKIACYTVDDNDWGHLTEMTGFESSVAHDCIYPTQPSTTPPINSPAEIESPDDEDVKFNAVWDGDAQTGTGKWTVTSAEAKKISVASTKDGYNSKFSAFIKGSFNPKVRCVWPTDASDYTNKVKAFNNAKNRYNYVWDVELYSSGNNLTQLGPEDRRAFRWNRTSLASATASKVHDIKAFPCLWMESFYISEYNNDGKLISKKCLFKPGQESYPNNYKPAANKHSALVVSAYTSYEERDKDEYRYIWENKTYMDTWWSYMFGEWMKADDNGVPPIETYREGMGWSLAWSNVYAHNISQEWLFELDAYSDNTKWDNNNNVAPLTNAKGPFRMQYKYWSIEGFVVFTATTMRWTKDDGTVNSYVCTTDDPNPYDQNSDSSGIYNFTTTDKNSYATYDHQTYQTSGRNQGSNYFPVVTVTSLNAVATNLSTGKRYKYSYTYSLNNPSNGATINQWTQIN